DTVVLHVSLFGRALQCLTNHVRKNRAYSPLMLAVLIIGHHFSISTFWKAPRAPGVCCARGKTSPLDCRVSMQLTLRGANYDLERRLDGDVLETDCAAPS